MYFNYIAVVPQKLHHFIKGGILFAGVSFCHCYRLGWAGTGSRGAPRTALRTGWSVREVGIVTLEPSGIIPSHSKCPYGYTTEYAVFPQSMCRRRRTGCGARGREPPSMICHVCISHRKCLIVFDQYAVCYQACAGSSGADAALAAVAHRIQHLRGGPSTTWADAAVPLCLLTYFHPWW